MVTDNDANSDTGAGIGEDAWICEDDGAGNWPNEARAGKSVLPPAEIRNGGFWRGPELERTVTKLAHEGLQSGEVSAAWGHHQRYME